MQNLFLHLSRSLVTFTSTVKMAHEIPRPDGKTVPVYVFEPLGNPKAPGVIVLQEWWGVNDQIKGLAKRFADAGFRAVVPDFYRGKVTKKPDEAKHFMGGLNWEDASIDMQGVSEFLKKVGNGKVGCTGFCMGGALALLAAQKAGITAASSFYGLAPEQHCNPSEIKVPLQLHWATHDDWCNKEQGAKLEDKLKHGHVPYEFFWYEGHHAFVNEQRPEVYNKEAAQTAMDRTIVLFGRHLF